MNRALRYALLGTTGAVFACAALVAAALVWGLPEQWLTLRIDGDELAFTHGHFGHWVFATVGVLIALIVALLVVPIVLVFSIGMPLLIVALMLSPLLVLGWLVYRIARNTGNTPAPRPTATIGT